MKKTAVSMMIILALCFAGAECHAEYKLPDTGQTKCYNDTAEITCPTQPGQDYYGQDGCYTINAPSYTKLDANGNALPDSETSWAMIKDNNTGLIWENKTMDGSIHDTNKTYTFDDAQNVFIPQLKAATGLNDWRLPTREELRSIVDYSTGPATNAQYFSNMMSSFYWSSSTYAYATSYEWLMNFSYGDDNYGGNKSNKYYALAVRLGQFIPINRFTDNGNGTVTDLSTGLMWQQATGNNGVGITWKAALAYCVNLPLAGYTDWRLPNIKELSFLVDLSRYNPAIDPKFSDTQLDYYWSSSTLANSINYARGVSFNHGYNYTNDKSNSYYYARCVRGGTSVTPPADTSDLHLLGNPARNGIATPIAGFGVNVVNGNFFHEETDAAMPGKDIPFVFSRSYNSLSEDKDKFGNDLPKPLGAGWTHAYNIALRSNGTSAEVIWGDGRHDGFAKSGSAWQAGTPGNFSTLSEVSGQSYAWELTTKSQMRYRFDTNGKLLSIVSRSGNSLSFSYSSDRLSSITDTAGRSITLTYNAGGQIDTVSLPPSRSFRFQYTGAGLLDRVIDMRGNFHRYTYLNGKLIQIKKANVEGDAPTPWLQISYDSTGKVDEQKSGHNLAQPDSGAYAFIWGTSSLEYRSPTGKGATYQWDTKFRTVKITPMNMSDAQPVNVAYTSDTGANSLLPKTRNDFIGSAYAYVFEGPNLKTVTDPLSQNYQQTYNSTNDLTGFQTPGGLYATVSPTSFGKPSSIYLFASQGGIPSPVSAGFSYDGAGQLTQMSIPGTSQSADVKTTVMSYSSDGQPLSVNSYVSYDAYLTTTYSYDAAGRRSGEQDHRGTWTCYYYDANDNLTDIAAGITSGCPSTPPSASVSIRHNKTEYDAENRVTARIEGYGSAVQRTMSYAYNDNAGVLAYTYDNNNSRRKEFWYDNDLAVNKIVETDTTREDRFYRHSNDRVRVVVENSNGIQGTVNRISRSAADPNGNLQKISSCFGVDSVGECTGETVRTFIIRDSLGRPTQVKQTVSDGNYRVVNYAYSSGGRIVTVTRGTGAEQTQDVYEYDALGRLIKVTQNGGITQAEYDSAGRLLKITDAQGDPTIFTYDGLGRIITRTDSDSSVSWQYTDSTGTISRYGFDTTITYIYNRLGELSQMTTSDGNTFTFGYDARGRLISENWSGTGGSGSRTYAYNVYGELTGVSGPFGISVNYTRDAIGRLTTKSFMGYDITYSYNALNQIRQMTTPAGTFQFNYYDFTGALGTTTFPNNAYIQRTRNMTDDLTQMNFSPSGLISYAIQLDSLGRRTGIQAEQPLAPSFVSEDLTFGYGTYGKLQDINNQTVTFDYRGNITQLPSPVPGTFAYDALDRLTSANGTQHKYDAARNRISTTRSGVETRYLLDLEPGLPDVVATLDSNNTVQEVFIHGPGGLLASIKNGQTRYVHQDFNHNVVAITDGTGAVKGAYAYTPMGKSAGFQGEDFAFKFAGGVGAMTDSEGLIYMRARYYHPGIRQFTSPDLIAGNLARPQSLARYAYVEGMALNGVDPSGLEECNSVDYNPFRLGGGSQDLFNTFRHEVRLLEQERGTDKAESEWARKAREGLNSNDLKEKGRYGYYYTQAQNSSFEIYEEVAKNMNDPKLNEIFKNRYYKELLFDDWWWYEVRGRKPQCSNAPASKPLNQQERNWISYGSIKAGSKMAISAAAEVPTKGTVPTILKYGNKFAETPNGPMIQHTGFKVNQANTENLQNVLNHIEMTQEIVK